MLLPVGDDGAALRAAAGPAAGRLRLRRHPRAVIASTLLGACVNGALAGFGGMFGGLLGLAIPLGAGVGAFLGGFTAAMAGTHVPSDELEPLWPSVFVED